MPEFWGCDTVAACNSISHGTTLADYVINTYYVGSSHDEIVWWGRHFDHGVGLSTWVPGEAISLSNAVKAYSNPVGNRCWIAPLASPATITGSTGAGTTAGNRVCAAIVAALNTRIALPGNNELYVYLDVEPGATLGVNWWTGWSEAVNNYAHAGVASFFPSVYMRKADSATLDTVLNHGDCYAVWSQQPQPSCSDGGCNSPGPAWNSDTFPSPLITAIWQYGEQTRCESCRGNLPPVDLDLTNPSVVGTSGYGICDNILYIAP